MYLGVEVILSLCYVDDVWIKEVVIYTKVVITRGRTQLNVQLYYTLEPVMNGVGTTWSIAHAESQLYRGQRVAVTNCEIINCSFINTKLNGEILMEKFCRKSSPMKRN